MKHIILASQSPQRQSLFATLGIEFEAVPADLDEKKIQHSDLKERAKLVAAAKAAAIRSTHPNSIIIAADTFVTLNGQALEKPESLDEARQMLRQQSGQRSVEYTGFYYQDPLSNITFQDTAEAKVLFRPLSEAEIEHYVTTQPVTTWSGAFCPAYPEGAALIAAIDGSFTGFTHGLPMEWVSECLIKSGVLEGGNNF